MFDIDTYLNVFDAMIAVGLVGMIFLVDPIKEGKENLYGKAYDRYMDRQDQLEELPVTINIAYSLSSSATLKCWRRL